MSFSEHQRQEQPAANTVDFEQNDQVINSESVRPSRPGTASIRKSAAGSANTSLSSVAAAKTDQESRAPSAKPSRPPSAKPSRSASIKPTSRPASSGKSRPTSASASGPQKAKSRTSSASSKTSKTSKTSKSSKSSKSKTTAAAAKTTKSATNLIESFVPASVMPKIHKLSKDEYTLIEACREGNIDTVYEQLSKGTNTNCRVPIVGTTPLAIACQKGSRSMAAVLLEFGAKIRGVKDEYKVTPVHWAANSKEMHLLQLLYKKGGLSANDLIQQDEYGSTPLHFAAVRNSPDVVQFLLAHGSNPLLTNNNNKKPSEVTSDESIRSKLLIKENAILDKRLQDRGRPPRRSTENLALIQPKTPSRAQPVVPSSRPTVAAKTRPSTDSKSSLNNDTVAKASKTRLRSFVAAAPSARAR